MSRQQASARRAVVTGGASGIGLEVARQLQAEGARVAVLDLPGERLERAAEILGPDASCFAADVRSGAAVRAAVGTADERLGGLDTLVCCAGVIHVKRLAEVTEEDWDLTLDVNLKGAFFCCQAAAPRLVESGRGRIVMIASDAGRRGVPLLQAYSASKFGLIGLAEAVAAELAPDVTVNCVCPVGVPTTAMGRQLLDWKKRATDQQGDEVLRASARELPMGRNASEADVAAAVLFLVSDAAGFITGVALDVDGGASLNILPGVD